MQLTVEKKKYLDHSNISATQPTFITYPSWSFYGGNSTLNFFDSEFFLSLPAGPQFI